VGEGEDSARLPSVAQAEMLNSKPLPARIKKPLLKCIFSS